jgi:hypothetical protein
MGDQYIDLAHITARYIQAPGLFFDRYDRNLVRRRIYIVEIHHQMPMIGQIFRDISKQAAIIPANAETMCIEDIFHGSFGQVITGRSSSVSRE